MDGEGIFLDLNFGSIFFITRILKKTVSIKSEGLFKFCRIKDFLKLQNHYVQANRIVSKSNPF